MARQEKLLFRPETIEILLSWFFWAFFPGKSAKMSWSWNKWIFSKLPKKLILCVGPMKLSWNLVYIRQNRWQIAIPNLKKTHFKVRRNCLFFVSGEPWRSAGYAFASHAAGCQIDSEQERKRPLTEEFFLVKNVFSYVRVSILLHAWFLKNMKVSVCRRSKKSSLEVRPNGRWDCSLGVLMISLIAEHSFQNRTID